MVLSYNLRILSRNKKRTFFLMLGIIISISLIISVDTANIKIANKMMEEQLGEIGVDFRMYETTQYSRSIKENLEKHIADSAILKTSISSTYVQFEQSYVQKGGGTIPWNATFAGNRITFNRSHFLGFEKDYTSDTDIAIRLQKIIRFPNNTIDLATTGLYIEKQTATRLQLTTGDMISIGFLYREYKNDYITGPYYAATDPINNITVDHPNIQILGLFDVLDTQLIRDYFSSSYGQYQTSLYFQPNDNIFFGNVTFLDTLFNSTRTSVNAQIEGTNNYIGLYRNFGYNIFIDYSKLQISDAQAIQRQISDINSGLYLIGSGQYGVDSRLQQIIWNVQSEIEGTRVLMFLIAIPVVLLSWFLVRTNFRLTFQQRRRELGLLKSKGGITPKIKRLFLTEALIIGAIGGVIGLFIGKIMTFIVLKIIYAETFGGLTIGNLLIQTFAEGFSTSNWFMSIGGGAIITLIAVYSPLKEFLLLNPVDALQKYQEDSEHELTNKKSDWVVFILGVVPMTLVLLMTILQQTGLMNNYIIYMLFSIFVPLLPFSPFLLIYGLVKLLCGRSINLFSKIITKISQIFSKQISVFTTKSILRNQARSARLVFIVAISISFMLLASTVAHSEERYQHGVQTLNTANGVVVEFSSSSMDVSNISAYSRYIWNKSTDLQLRGINWVYSPQSNGLWEDGQYKIVTINSMDYSYSGYVNVAAISAQNFSEFADMQDNWFVQTTATEAMKTLSTTPNGALMPDFMMKAGYKVNSEFQIRYKFNSTAYYVQDLVVVGFYKYFPLQTSSGFYGGISKILIDESAISQAQIEQVKMVIYSDLDPKPKANELLSLLREFDPTITQPNYYDYYYGSGSDSMLRLMQSITRFLDLESYYMLFIVVAGVGIIMYISIREKSHDMGILRARGIDRGVVFKIQLAEGTTLIILGLIFSLIGILGAKAILLEFDLLFGYFTQLKRDLLVPWGKIAIQLLISLALFVGIIGLAVKIESKNSNIGPISELLRIS